MTAPPLPLGPHLETPILVTGLPRSGTSMVTGLLGECGLWLGATGKGGRYNPRGVFENFVLREKVQKALLAYGGFDPYGVERLPPHDWEPDVEGFLDGIRKVLAAQGYDGQRPWGFKDAKMTLTWRTWNQQLPAARWVIVRRPSEQVVASCLRTSFMSRHSADPAFWHRLVDSYLERLADLQRTVGWSRIVESPDVAAGRLGSLRTLVGELGLSWRRDAVRAFVAPGFWHVPDAWST